MAFRFEKDMTAIVSGFLRSLGCVVIEESALLNNCDVTGCVFNDAAVRERIGRRQKTPLSPRELHLMRMDKKPWPEWMPIYDRIIAVELKLTRMAEVIDQAYLDAYCVTDSYIAMPRDYAVKAVEKANTAKVGVIAVDEGCEVILEPAHHKHRNAHDLAENFWRCRRKEYLEQVGKAVR